MACACPASRQKSEPGVSKRDIHGSVARGAYTSEARPWSDTPRWAANCRQDTVVAFTPKGKGSGPFIGGISSGCLISYQGNQRRGRPLTAPMVSYHQLGPGHRGR